MHDTTLLIKTAILLITGSFLIFLMVRKKAHTQPLALFVLMLLSLFILSGWGSLQKIYPRASSGMNREMKTRLFQWHEIWHYYAGSKYFKELGYYGLYDAYVAADAETKPPDMAGVRAANIRNLKDTHYYYPTSQALDQGRTLYKPRFTEERWAEFKRDYVFMKSIADEQAKWIDKGLWDVGFNPPPTWCVIAHPIANAISISSGEGENYYLRGLIFPLFDLALLAGIGVLLYRSFGLVGLSTFFIIFGTSYISELRWNMGSFLRYMWLFGLVGGACMLKEKKYLQAGLFLGFSTCCRAFPFIFLSGAGLSLLVQGYRTKEWTPLRQLCKGAAIIGFGLFFAGLLLFGWSAYAEFFEMIGSHKEISFIQSIGYKKIATFGDWMGLPLNFWWEAGLHNFREWNEGAAHVWDQVKWMHYPVFILTLAGVLWAMRDTEPHEAMLLWGGLFLFFTQILTCYYYVYFALIPVVLFNRNSPTPISRCVLLAGFFGLWIFTVYGGQLHRDGIIANYYICWSFLLFFGTWVIVRVLPTRLWTHWKPRYDST